MRQRATLGPIVVLQEGQQSPAPATEPELLRAVLDRDEAAWREFVRRYDPELREVVRHSTRAIAALDETTIDDVLGDFWLHMVDGDFRMLRTFDPTRRAASLLTWLTFQVAHIANDHLRKTRRERKQVPLDCAGDVAIPPVPPPRLRGEAARAEAEQVLLSDLADFLVTLTLDGKLANENDVSDGK